MFLYGTKLFFNHLLGFHLFVFKQSAVLIITHNWHNEQKRTDWSGMYTDIRLAITHWVFKYRHHNGNHSHKENTETLNVQQNLILI